MAPALGGACLNPEFDEGALRGSREERVKEACGGGEDLVPKDTTQSRRQCAWCQLSGAPLRSKPPQVEGKWIQRSPSTPI